MDTYDITLCGLTRTLPLVHVGRQTRVANFSMLGDVELVDRLADAFAERLREVPFDYLVGSDVKTVPLVHGVSKRLGHHRYVVCRKSIRPYMVQPIVVKPLPHFPKHVRPVVLNRTDAELLQGKRVVVMDDVISTGVTFRMLRKLMDTVGATIVVSAVVFRQGQQFDEIGNLMYLGELPIFGTAPDAS